ncbi:hypothetical protein Q6249_28645, partial [Klebsiella pneumoniae]|jgi:hypothetical protein|uniref:hypothetical protein n=1 Tax=Klebsiella pneumoniae TaxID=573 RepID=UPI0027320CE4
MYVSLPTLDLRKIQDDIRLSPIGLQSIVFNYARLPLSCFYGNPYLQLLTEAQNRIRAFPQTRRCGFALSRFGGFVRMR